MHGTCDGSGALSIKSISYEVRGTKKGTVPEGHYKRSGTAQRGIFVGDASFGK